MHRTHYLIVTEYTFSFSKAYGTHDSMMSCKARLSTLERGNSYKGILSDYGGIKMDINNKKIKNLQGIET